MANTTQAPEVNVVTDMAELPGGVLAEGVSPSEAAEGLFELLGSEEDSPEQPESEDDGAGFDDEDLEDVEDFDDEEIEEDDLEVEDDEDEPSDESEDGENDDEEVEALYEVTLPGGEKAEVTLDELRAGYSRTEDYTRKRQRDAAEHAGMLAETRERRDAYAEGLERLEATLRELGPTKPDAELRKSNPGEFAAQLAEWQEFDSSIAAIGEARGVVESEISQEALEAQQAYVNQQWELAVTKVPEWADEAKAVSDLAALKSFAMSEYEFSDEEISGLSDARLLLMLKNHYDLTQAQKAGEEGVNKKRRSSKRLAAGKAKSPGARKNSRRDVRRSADQRAASSGRVTDAARAIELALAAEDL